MVYGLEYTNYILKQNILYYYVSLIIKWFLYIMFVARKLENYSTDFDENFRDSF